MHVSSAAQDHVVSVDDGSRHDGVISWRRVLWPVNEECRTVWREGRFFKVVWELKILVWGLIAIAVAYEAVYWLSAWSVV